MILFVCALSIAAGEADPRVFRDIERFEAMYHKLKSMQFVMKKTDRMRDGEVINEGVMVKWRKGGDFYLSSRLPREGQEVIYSAKRDRNKLIVHPGTFPDLTLWLAVHGDLVLNKQRHPIYHIDPGYALQYMKRAVKDIQRDSTLGSAKYLGEETRYGRTVNVMRLEAGNMAPKRVAAVKGETLIDFAHRNGADPYVCYTANPEVSKLNSKLDEGALYNVPPYYGEKSEFAFDKETGFFIEHKIWNGDGELVEQLARVDLVFDPELTDLDFDEKNPKYKF